MEIKPVVYPFHADKEVIINDEDYHEIIKNLVRESDERKAMKAERENGN